MTTHDLHTLIDAAVDAEQQARHSRTEGGDPGHNLARARAEAAATALTEATGLEGDFVRACIRIAARADGAAAGLDGRAQAALRRRAAAARACLTGEVRAGRHRPTSPLAPARPPGLEP